MEINIDKMMNEIENSVLENVNINEVAKYNHILIIKSARNQICNNCIEILLKSNEKLHISILGEDGDQEILQNNGIPIQNLYIHRGRFNVEECDDYILGLPLDTMDCICFLNYSTHSESYLNVEQVCAKLLEYKDIKVFSYLGGCKTFNEYLDIRTHEKGISAYCALIKWAEHLIERGETP